MARPDLTYVIVNDASGDIVRMSGASMTPGAGETQYEPDFSAYTTGPPKYNSGPVTVTSDTTQVDADARKGTRTKAVAKVAATKFDGANVNPDACLLHPMLMAKTTDATVTEMTVDAAAPAAGNRLGIVDDTSWSFLVHVHAQRDDQSECALYEIKGLLVRASGTTTLLYSNVTVLYEDAAAWDVTVAADDTNDSLKVTVTGEAAKNINWLLGPAGLLCIGAEPVIAV